MSLIKIISLEIINYLIYILDQEVEVEVAQDLVHGKIEILFS